MTQENSLVIHPPIIVPEGKMAAPHDHRIGTYHLAVPGSFELSNIPQIELTSPGNCAEYTTINMALILHKLGAAVNPELTGFLGRLSSQALATVEIDLVIPLIMQAQKALKANVGGFSAADSANLLAKVDRPTEPLTNLNSVLFF